MAEGLGGGPASQETSNHHETGLVMQIATAGHENWRAPRKKEDGTYEPCVKVLVEEINSETGEKQREWYNEDAVPQGVHEVLRQDIANTNFPKLHEDWQKENIAQARSTLRSVRTFFAEHPETRADFVTGAELAGETLETLAAIAHGDFLERRRAAGIWIPPEQDVDYADLPDEELLGVPLVGDKQDDRAWVITTANAIRPELARAA